MELGLQKDKLISQIFRSTFNAFGTRIAEIQVLWNGIREDLIEVFDFDHANIGQAFFEDLKLRLVTQYRNHTLLKPFDFAKVLDFNFNKHTLKIAIWNDASQVFLLTKVFEVLSKELNFTLNLTYIDFSYARTHKNLNIELLRNRSIDCSYHFCNTEPFPGVSALPPYSIIALVTVFPPRKSFDLDSLLLIVFTERCFAYAAICIILICLVLVFKTSALRRDISRVILEVSGVFYGYSLTFTAHFETLIVGFGVLGLLVRTNYQAAYFKVMTLDMFDEHPSNLQEIQERNFKVIIPHFGFDASILLKSLPKGFQAVTSRKTGQELLDSINQLPYDTGIFVDKYKAYYNLKHELIDPRTHIILESILNLHRCLYFQENHPLRELFEHYIDILKESGFMEKWSYTDITAVKLEINKEPVQIRLTDISNAFILLGGGVTISCLGFLMEIVFSNFKP